MCTSHLFLSMYVIARKKNSRNNVLEQMSQFFEKNFLNFSLDHFRNKGHKTRAYPNASIKLFIIE